MLRREVPGRTRQQNGALLFNVWVALLSALLLLGFLSLFGAIFGCGRGGAPPCFPQPATSTGPGGHGPAPCEVRR